MKKYKVAWHPAWADGCALFRVFMPHLKLEGSAFVIPKYAVDEGFSRQFQIGVVQRLYSLSNYEAIKILKRAGLKLVYDLDDDLWNVPVYNPMYETFKQVIDGFGVCVHECEVVTVSTDHLKLAVRRALGKNCPRIEVIENAVDFDWFQPLPDSLKKDKKGRVVIGWAGSNTHEGDVKKVFDTIPELMKELPEVDFELVGMSVPESWKELGGRVRTRQWVPVAEWPVAWASWQWDISLAPLKDNEFNRSKSSLKMIEAAAVKIPCVASRVAPYQKFCQTSKLLKEKLLAEGPLDWKRKITALVKDSAFRNEMGMEMYRVARETCDIKDRVEKWKEIFDSIL